MWRTKAYQLSIDYKLQYYEFWKKIYFDEKSKSPPFFLNGTVHFLIFHSMQFLVFRKKTLRYLRWKMISLNDVLALMLNLLHEIQGKHKNRKDLHYVSLLLFLAPTLSMICRINFIIVTWLRTETLMYKWIKSIVFHNLSIKLQLSFCFCIYILFSFFKHYIFLLYIYIYVIILYICYVYL
jgi:hypothetical protein